MGGVNLSRIEPGDATTFSADGVHVHVWFDAGVAKTDFGDHVPDSGEWQVIVSTSPDRLNLSPRGRELARKEFRYADPRHRDLVLGAAQDFVRSSLFRYRGKV